MHAVKADGMAVIDLSTQGWHQATKGKWPAEMDNRKKMAELEEKYDMKTGCLPMRTNFREARAAGVFASRFRRAFVLRGLLATEGLNGAAAFDEGRRK